MEALGVKNIKELYDSARYEASGMEFGEPAHPLIHVFKDEKGNLTSLEIIDINRFIEEPLEKLVQAS